MGGHVFGGKAVEHLPAKRQPGFGGEAWLDQREQALHHVAVVLAVEELAELRLAVAELFELGREVAAADRDRPMLP